MAYPQYNHQWTPMYQATGHEYNNHVHNSGYGPAAQWTTNAPMQGHSQPWQSSQSSFSYKPATITQTLEVDDASSTAPLTNGTIEESVPPWRKQSFQQKYLGGLKRTLRLFALLAFLVLAGNIGWLIYGQKRYGIKTELDGYRYGTIQSGDCTQAKRLNTWLHLAINVMSTLLLTGSNAFMAAYSGPTRQEVDQAHAKRKWLHIGSMSFRNIRGIAKRKSLVVLLLALSSTPFHLLYNSLVFTSLAANDYYWAVVTEDFLTGASYNLTGPPVFTNFSGQAEWTFYVDSGSATMPDGTIFLSESLENDTAAVNTMYQYFDDIQKSAPSWERLDTKTCIQQYSNVFLSTSRNVVMVSSTQNASNSILEFGSSDLGSALDSNYWICSQWFQDGETVTCNPEKFVANASSWTVFGNPVEYCLSEKVDDICSVKFSWDIMVILVAFNALKAIAMLWILLRIDAEQILTSVGDAAASFVKSPDLTTLGICLASKRNINDYWRSPGFARLFDGISHRRWGQAVSKKRWILFFLIIIVSFAIVFLTGILGFTHVSDAGVSLSLSSLWSLGFGRVSQYTMVIYGGGGNAITMTLLANTPQIFLALIYLVYQGIITAMFNAADWAKFAVAPQTLIVSTPAGKQRGTWLLGAPLPYGIGIVALQTLLHWFVSQSIFVVQLAVYNKLGDVDPTVQDYSNCGYSPIGIIFSVVACILLCLTAVVFMLRSLPVGAPPVVSTCSAAISAACHVPPAMRDESLVYRPLRWGVTDRSANGIGHCSLGSAEGWDHGRGSQPVSGWAYAGSSKLE